VVIKANGEASIGRQIEDQRDTAKLGDGGKREN
jgi:hypothetical protein